jgi:hypothetical protein
MSKSKVLLAALNEMARGVVVLDADLLGLKDLLRDKNMHVVVPRKQNLEDFKIKQELLTKRIFITNNSKDFVDDAVALEYGIIATEKVNKDLEKLASMISKALSKYNLWSKQFGFILKLKPSGKHEFKILQK